ncbi:hypothetical protein LIER_35262 [Lithospermum erythrorhizon]|uniref:C3HC-type domain-containing protein n=1 Tax=Lithospermum erythrorhizon TaxID=34254 RepID=A0AAV3NNM7_LITER
MDESEKRFNAVMDKLFHAPPRLKSTIDSRDQLGRGKKRMNPWSDLSVGEQNSRGNAVNNLQRQSGSLKSVQPPQCRPWDRGDLFRRLATFKSMTWFAKPQAMSAINCARRGWINVDIDTITCEACGARLLVSTPQAWTQEQIEKTALVYSLKLDSGHKLLCPWVDNICDEGLAQFPPKQSFVLVGDYKKCYNALSQLLALPAISSSAIDYMKSPQLDRFLKGHPISENIATTQISKSDHLGYEADIMSSVSYDQV